MQRDLYYRETSRPSATPTPLEVAMVVSPLPGATSTTASNKHWLPCVYTLRSVSRPSPLSALSR